MGTRLSNNRIIVSAILVGPDNSDPLSNGEGAVAVKLERQGSPPVGFVGRGKTSRDAIVSLVENMLETGCLKMPEHAQR